LPFSLSFFPSKDVSTRRKCFRSCLFTRRNNTLYPRISDWSCL